MTKTVLILGASRYYTKSLSAVRRAGYRVAAADRNPQAAGFSAVDLAVHCDIADREGILKAARELGVSAVVPVNDVGVPTASFVCERLGLIGISAEAARNATQKAFQRQVWKDKGLPCPPFALAMDKPGITRAIDEVGLPCILKPAHGTGGGSRGVIAIHTPQEIPQAIDFSLSFYDDPATLVEGLVDADLEHSAEVLLVRGQPHVLAVSDKIKTPLPFRVDKNILYPSRVTGRDLAAMKALIGQAVLALGIETGAAHVELASTRAGLVLFELGARPGGGGTPEPIIPHVTGIPAFVETVRILADDPPGNLDPGPEQGCNYHFLTPPPGRLRQVEGLEEVLAWPGILDADVLIKTGERIPLVRTGPDRAGFVIASAKTRQEAHDLGMRAEQRIRFTIEEG